jgi:hypothetical protein
MADEIAGLTQHNLAELRRWYEEYVALDLLFDKSHDVLKVLNHDRIDSEEIEQKILQHASSLPGLERFCMDCKEALNDWHELDAEGYIRTSNTIALEAAARKGCQFCCFVLHILVDEGMLRTFRRIEARLNSLGECEEFKIALNLYKQAIIQLPGRGLAAFDGIRGGSFGLIYLDSIRE